MRFMYVLTDSNIGEPMRPSPSPPYINSWRHTEIMLVAMGLATTTSPLQLKLVGARGGGAISSPLFKSVGIKITWVVLHGNLGCYNVAAPLGYCTPRLLLFRHPARCYLPQSGPVTRSPKPLLLHHLVNLYYSTTLPFVIPSLTLVLPTSSCRGGTKLAGGGGMPSSCAR